MSILSKYLLLLMFVTGSASLLYGEYLEYNASPITELPTDLVCEHDVLFNQYICFKEHS